MSAISCKPFSRKHQLKINVNLPPAPAQQNWRGTVLIKTEPDLLLGKIHYHGYRFNIVCDKVSVTRLDKLNTLLNMENTNRIPLLRTFIRFHMKSVTMHLISRITFLQIACFIELLKHKQDNTNDQTAPICYLGQKHVQANYISSEVCNKF